MTALDELLGAMSRAMFFRDFYGKRAVHLPTNLPAAFFGWQQLSQVLNFHGGLPPNAKILADGKEIVPPDYLVLLRDLRRGQTMLFENIDRFDERLSAFLDRLSGELLCQTRFNLYLSSPGRRGRHVHYDAHDVFILQVEGSKRWYVHEVTDAEPIHARKNHDFDAPSSEEKPYLDCVLKKGDVLYLPRGHWHDVVPLDEVSLHLTLGLFVPNGIDFLSWLVDECTEVETARQNLPIRVAYPTDEEYLAARRKFFDEVVNTLSQRATLEALAEDYLAYLVASLPNRTPFSFPYSMGRDELNPSIDVRMVSAGHTTKLLHTEGSRTACLVFSNRVVDFPSEAIEMVRRALGGASFSRRDLYTEFSMVAAEHIDGTCKLLAAEGLVVPQSNSSQP